MIRKRTQHVQNSPRVPLPSLLLDHHKTEQLGIYLMFVNGHVFLVPTSFNIKFGSIINMQGCGSTEAENGLKTTISAFTVRKINIETIVFDKECEALRKSLRSVHIKIVGDDEHEDHV